ncbi:hypothetical protein PP182_19670 [Maribacter sp. PR1]|uniref:Uncharacterized protein n=1 Tax=Maribacter cobaltidurans TaxID=1178778 RepID=A0ABU7IZ88_9FLAO|nr:MULTISPECIES: hypothetical protein [Maribacter]MDC6390914.1 hypothetical protein [Maribacter sp. PR1]MEE1978306.1 hypothetical protein [Maribacter cobaltidurans]
MKTKMVIIIGVMALALSITSCTKEQTDLIECLQGDCPEEDESTILEMSEIQIDSVSVVKPELD